MNDAHAAEVRRDRWAAAGILALAVAGVLLRLAPEVTVLDRTSRAWHLLPAAIGCAALLVQRRRPWLTVSVAAAMVAVDGWWGFSIGVFAVLWEALYTATLTVSWSAVRRLRMAGVAAVVLAVMVLGLAGRDVAVVANGGLLMFALLLMPIWWAVDVRRQADVAAMVRRQAEQERAGVLMEERARMSRELHDAVAGDLSSIAIHAEAGLRTVRADQPGHAALTAVRGSALHAMTELSRMITVLRRDQDAVGEDPRTAPGLADLGELLSHTQRSGMRVESDMPETGTALPPVVDHAVYRIVQEALTNARRYGSGQADLRVHTGADQVSVTVTNRPSAGMTTATGVVSAAHGQGLGLLTMRERAEALGGRFEAGWATASTAGRGREWRVQASIPLRP